MRPGRFFRARLHRRLFVWFGLTILLTTVVVGVTQAVVTGAAGGPSWREEGRGAMRFVASRVARVWDDETARTELVATLAAEVRLGVVLEDADGGVLERVGGECRHALASAPVVVRGETVGRVTACPGRHGGGPGRGIVGLLTALGVLWLASGALARRILRPLREVTAVAEAIGAGDLSARVRERHKGEPRRGGDDIQHVGRTLNDMADRIQRQIEDQRELLAAVSHEMRTPLGHLRVLSEMLKDQHTDPARVRKHAEGIEREVAEMDDLIGQLLASSRLDFRAHELAEQAPLALAGRALERAGLPAERLVDDGAPAAVRADATLLLRALANLIDNAERHGGGLKELRVEGRDGEVRFAACDEGEGFTAGDEDQAFAAFFSRDRTSQSADGKGSLGLGLALVRRIARAHDGEAFVEARAGGGACVGFAIPAGESAAR